MDHRHRAGPVAAQAAPAPGADILGAALADPQTPLPASPPLLQQAAYGYGWFVADLAGHHVLLAAGDQPGYTAQLLYRPIDGLALAVLAIDAPDLDPIISLVLDVFPLP